MILVPWNRMCVSGGWGWVIGREEERGRESWIDGSAVRWDTIRINQAKGLGLSHLKHGHFISLIYGLPAPQMTLSLLPPHHPSLSCSLFHPPTDCWQALLSFLLHPWTCIFIFSHCGSPPYSWRVNSQSGVKNCTGWVILFSSGRMCRVYVWDSWMMPSCFDAAR